MHNLNVLSRIGGAMLSAALLANPEAACAQDTGERGLRVARESIPTIIAKGGDRPLYHALVIGINGYNADAGWLPLAFPESDATRLAELLKKSYEFSTVETLVGEKTRKQDILTALDDHAQRMGPNDAWMMFFAGHGHQVKEGADKGGYWIPSDGSQAPSSWVSLDHVHSRLKNCQARHILLASDSCYAGAFFTRGLKVVPEAKAVAPELDLPGFYRRQLSKPSQYIITSGDLETVPDRSAFTEKILSMLEADAVVFSAEDIYHRIKDEVYEITGKQVIAKEMREDGAGGNFIFLQTAPVSQQALLVLQVKPDNAKVTLSGSVIHHTSQVVLNDVDERVREHRIRVEPGCTYVVSLEAPGHESFSFNWQASSRQKLRKSVTLREWIPRRIESNPPPEATVQYPNRPAANAILASLRLEQKAWLKEEQTCTGTANHRVLTAAATYTRSMNSTGSANRKGPSATYGATVHIHNGKGWEQEIPCYPLGMKEKDETSTRKIRSMLFLPKNERFLAVLGGDHLFLLDCDSGSMVKKLRLPNPLDERESADLGWVEKNDQCHLVFRHPKHGPQGFSVSTK